ncbi:GNAT family N-acetyltransferase, partial [Yersinia pestis]
GFTVIGRAYHAETQGTILTMHWQHPAH